MNRANGFFVVLLVPTEFPARSAAGPRAKANGRDGQVRVTELGRFHIDLRNRIRFRMFNSVLFAAIQATALCRAIDFRLR
jgi:hypothetical protein